MLSWLPLTLLSQFSLVVFSFFSKRLLNKEEIDPRLYGACLQIMTGLVALPFALYQGISFTLDITSFFLLIAMTIVYAIGPSLYYIGLKHVDLSETTILDSSGAIWSVLFGIFLLGEQVSLLKFVGVGFILLAVMTVSFNFKSLVLRFNKFELLLLIAPVFYAIGAVIDNKLVSHSNALSYMAISFLLAGTFMLLTNVHRIKDEVKSTFSDVSFYKTVGLSGIFLFLTYYCIMLAYQLGGEVSRMYPVQQLESVIVPMLGIIFLKERKRVLQKIIAVFLAALGVLLLWT